MYKFQYPNLKRRDCLSCNCCVSNICITVSLLACLSTSSLQITDGSFRYASPRLWNQLVASLRRPHNLSDSNSPFPMTGTSFINSPLSSFTITLLFHTMLKIALLFHTSFPPYPPLSSSGLTPWAPQTVTVTSEISFLIF